MAVFRGKWAINRLKFIRNCHVYIAVIIPSSQTAKLTA